MAFNDRPVTAELIQLTHLIVETDDLDAIRFCS
jgi:hypothetical protein